MARSRGAPAKRSRKPRLTERQKRFIEEYLVDGIGAHAAVRAGYSAATAKNKASTLLALPHVRDALLTAMRAREKTVTEKAAIDAAWVLRELADLWRVDVRAIFRPDGQLRPIHELSDAAAKLVASFEVIDAPGGLVTKKVRIIDRLRVLEDIGKHVSVLAFKEQKSVDFPNGVPVTLDIGDNPAVLAEIARLLGAYTNPPPAEPPPTTH